MKKHTLIEVRWLDSQGTTSMWCSKSDLLWKQDELRTVGYFVRFANGYLYLVQSISPDQYGRKFRIPRRCIKTITKLRK